MRIVLQPAFLLHRLSYSDSSRICEFFTLNHGRVSALAKSIWRKERGGSFGNLIRPFVPLLISCSGRTELKTLTKVELAGATAEIKGDHVFCGLYINELVIKFLERYDPQPKLFAHYAKILSK